MKPLNNDPSAASADIRSAGDAIKAAGRVGCAHHAADERTARDGHPTTLDLRPTALDGRTFAIGILAVTACILFVGLILLLNAPAPAYAAGQNDRGGDYIMLTQQLSESTEGVLVIDAASKIGLLYYYDYNKKSVEVLSPKLRLDKLPGDGQNAPNAQKGAPRRRGG